MRAPRTDPGASDFENDYQVISLSISWGMLSIAAFAVILTLQLFGRVLGVSLAQVIGATLVLSIAGFALALIGLRFDRGRGAATVGAFLNGVVLGIFLLVPVASQVLRRLG